MGRTRVRRRRFTVAAVLVGTVILGPGARAWSRPTLGGERGPPQPNGAVVVREYVVAPGDTIWGIASRARPGRDPRPLVRAIELQNRLRPDELVPGQTLLIPIPGGHA